MANLVVVLVCTNS